MEKMKKSINTVGKICRVFSIIFMVLMIISTVSLLIIGFILSLVPQDLIQADVDTQVKIETYGDFVDQISEEDKEAITNALKNSVVKVAFSSMDVKKITQKGQSLILETETGTMHFTLRRLGLALLPLSLQTGALIIVFIMLTKLMKEFAYCETPFSESVIKALRAFAFSLIPYAVIKMFSSSLSLSILTTNTFSFSLNVDLKTVIYVLAILLVAMIFRYGAELQKKSAPQDLTRPQFPQDPPYPQQ